jgi:hypothetical protein
MNPRIELLDVVALAVDTPMSARGHVSTVVEMLAPQPYQVEFCDDDGLPYATLALDASQLMVLYFQPDADVYKSVPA